MCSSKLFTLVQCKRLEGSYQQLTNFVSPKIPEEEEGKKETLVIACLVLLSISSH